MIIRLWTPNAKTYEIGPFDALRVTSSGISAKRGGDYVPVLLQHRALWCVSEDEKLMHLRGFAFDFFTIENQ